MTTEKTVLDFQPLINLIYLSNYDTFKINHARQILLSQFGNFYDVNLTTFDNFYRTHLKNSLFIHILAKTGFLNALYTNLIKHETLFAVQIFPYYQSPCCYSLSPSHILFVSACVCERLQNTQAYAGKPCDLAKKLKPRPQFLRVLSYPYVSFASPNVCLRLLTTPYVSLQQIL